MDELQYLAFLAARKATADLRNEAARSTLPTRAVPSERHWRHWRRWRRRSHDTGAQSRSSLTFLSGRRREVSAFFPWSS